MDRHSTTVTNVIEGCVYIRRRFYAISPIRGELQHSSLRSLLLLSSLSSNITKIRTLVRPRGGQGIQAWTLRTPFRAPASRIQAVWGSCNILHGIKATRRYTLR